MPRYRILRRLPGWSEEQLEAAALRAAFCLYAFDGAIRWDRSYFDPARGELHCIYEAPDEERVRDHARIAQIPCDEVTEVRELLPDRFLEQAEAEGEAAVLPDRDTPGSADAAGST